MCEPFPETWNSQRENEKMVRLVNDMDATNFNDDDNNKCNVSHESLARAAGHSGGL